MYSSTQGNQNNQGNNNTNSNNFAKTTFNLQPPQFSNQGFLSPQGGTFSSNRGVYASTIQASTSSNFSSTGFGLGKLASMGRSIKEDTDTVDSKVQQAPITFQSSQTGLSFRSNNDKSKLASSVIFQKNNDDDLNRFPGFNVGQSNPQQFGTSRLDALLAKKPTVQTPKQQVNTQSAQDKRKREITAIKQELQFLNKRMENTVGKKVQGQNKVYFQLPTRKTTANTQISKQANQAGTSQSIAENKPLSLNLTKAPQLNTQHFGNMQNITQIKVSPAPVASSINQPVGMFKKKNPYLNDESNKPAQYTPKTFMLSPKGANIGQGFKTEPINTKMTVFQAKSAEVVQNFASKNSTKPVFSVQKANQTPKSFKKSDFAIGKKMGKGQFGEVMLVQHKLTGFLCGMKVMSKKQIRQQKYVNQVARQLSIQFYLNHRNVAPLYGYFEDQQNVYLLIEYCTGGQLLQLLRKSHRMEEADTSPIIRQICQGLDYIHKEQIIHRDIKPENILFNFNTVKICDFGWAVHCGSGMRKTVSGSPLYYSPQIVKQTEYDEKVDIWAVGMMTYECLLGKIPFRIYSELDLNRIVEDEVKFPEYVDVSDEAKSFILGIMQKNPDDRMVMKDIFKHPFIRKYLTERKVGNQILEEFRRILG